MLTFKSDESGNVIEVSTSIQHGAQWVSRWQFETFAMAERIAASATKLTGELHIATDDGEYHSPRYDVIAMPKVGDKVSYAFNGDYYPDGEIVNISASLRIITTTSGRKYYRRRLKGLWLNGRMWCLVQGHVSRWNPEF